MRKSRRPAVPTERFYSAEARKDGGVFKRAAMMATALFALASFVVRTPARTDDDAPPDGGSPFETDRDMQRVLDVLSGLPGRPTGTLEPADARRQPALADAVTALLASRGKETAPAAVVRGGVASVDRTIPGPASRLPVRVYTPDLKGRLPVVVYFHGGWWVTGDIDRYDASARGLARAARAIVVSVGYRRAPEARFPAAWEDALAAWGWVAARAATIGGDPTKLAVAGEGAGGGLAIATAIAARDAGLPAPRHVVAVCPAGQVGDLLTESYVDSALARPLDKATMRWSIGHLVARPDDRRDARLDLVHADLAGLPHVTIINAQIDPVRADGAKLETALKAAGVKVDRKVYAGVTHDFFGAAAVVSKAADAQSMAGGALRRALR